MNIMELCSEHDRLEKEREALLRGESHTGAVNPERFHQVADDLRKIHGAIRKAVQAVMQSQCSSLAATESLSYFAAWQSLRIFSQH
jgi:hypothetical protein